MKVSQKLNKLFYSDEYPEEWPDFFGRNGYVRATAINASVYSKLLARDRDEMVFLTFDSSRNKESAGFVAKMKAEDFYAFCTKFTEWYESALSE